MSRQGRIWRAVTGGILAWLIIGTDVLPPVVSTHAQRVGAQGYSYPPVMQPFQITIPLVLPYTAGTITVGGFQQAVAAGTVTLVDNQPSCVAPQFPACNLIYWSPASPSIVLASTNPSVALATGNVVIAYVTTAGGLVTNAVTANLTLETSPGTATPFGVSTSLLPLCNAVVTRICQPVKPSLSGY